MNSGDLERAGAANREAVELMAEVGDHRASAYLTVQVTQVTQVDLARGDAGGALACAKKTLSVFEELGERRGAVRALAAVAEANLALGLRDEVIDVATAALENYADAGDAAAEDRLRVALAERGNTPDDRRVEAAMGNERAE